jgi:hypothetical protein
MVPRLLDIATLALCAEPVRTTVDRAAERGPPRVSP